jgi:pimeloyl-ACP methyl ester carboxylesterase
MWKSFPRELAEASGCRILVYSRLGHGQSDALQARRSVAYLHEEALTVLPALLDATGVKQPILFGHSDGASIALIFAATMTQAPAGVIALAPHVKVEDLSIASIARAKEAFETQDLRAKLARYHRDVDSTFWGWNRIWLDPAFRGWNIESLLPEIRCPVMAIQGVDDAYGTMEQVDAIARALPGTPVLKLDHCGHSAHRDQPAAVLAATRRFAKELAQTAEHRY